MDNTVCVFSFHQSFLKMSTKTNTVMTLLRFFLLMSFSILITAQYRNCSANEEIYNRLSPDVIPVHYDLALLLHETNENKFDGEVNITINIKHNTQHITFHAKHMELNGQDLKLISKNNTIYKATDYQTYYQSTDIKTLRFDESLLPGIYTLHIRYIGFFTKFDDQPGLRIISDTKTGNDTGWFFATDLRRTGAHYVFPCWDEPALKATFNISVKHHTNHTAFSNMPIRLQQFDDTNNTSMWSYFETTPLMSTYLVGIAVIDVHDFSNKKSNFNIWYRQGLDSEVTFAKYIVDEVANQLTDYINATFKLPKLDIILIPNYMYRSNSLGLTLLKESLVTYNDSKNSVDCKMNVARKIAYVMAHQWVEVGPTSWSHAWLNEGLTLFFEKYTLNQIFKEWQVMDLSVNMLHKSFFIDDNIQKRPMSFEPSNLSEIESLDTFIIMDKAYILLRMLKFMVSDEIFREGIITYLHKHQFSSATPNDLWDAMQHALNNSHANNKNIEIKTVMDTWIKESSYPLVLVMQDYNKIMIMQKHFYYYEFEEDNIDKTWWTPVTYTSLSNPDFSNTTSIQWLKSQHSDILLHIDLNDMIIVNLQQAGYYRVDYNTNWKVIAKYLHSDNFTKIHVANRAQLINDAYYFLVERKVHFAEFLYIAKYLSKEVDYVPWLSMFTILPHMSKFFSLQLQQGGILKSHILAILNGLLHNIGYEDNPTDSDVTKLMRATALSWACSFDDIKCTLLAIIKLQQRIANFTQYASVMSHEKWIYCSALKTANFTTWRKIMNLCCTMDICMDTCLEVLTCSEKSEIIIEYLKILLNTDEYLKDLPITEWQQNHFFNMLITKHARNNAVLKYILYDEFWLQVWSFKFDGINMLIQNIILNVYTEKQLREIQRFTERMFDDETGWETLIAMRLTYLNDITRKFSLQNL